MCVCVFVIRKKVDNEQDIKIQPYGVVGRSPTKTHSPHSPIYRIGLTAEPEYRPNDLQLSRNLYFRKRFRKTCLFMK